MKVSQSLAGGESQGGMGELAPGDSGDPQAGRDACFLLPQAEWMAPEWLELGAFQQDNGIGLSLPAGPWANSSF